MAVTFELSTIMRLYETIREMPQIPPALLWRIREETDVVAVMCVHRMEPDLRGLLQGWLSMAPATEVMQQWGTVPQYDVMAVWWVQRQGLQWEPSDEEHPDDQEGEPDQDEEGYVSAVAQPGTPPLRTRTSECDHKHRKQDWTVLESKIKPGEPKLSVQLWS